MGGLMTCHPRQTSSSSPSLRLSAMIFVIAFTSRQSVPFGPRQYLPLPYVPSIHLVIWVSSACSLESEGAGRGMAASLSSVSLRRTSSGSFSLS
jgi:hypothetical protein